jgi:hypothetical protein
MADVFYYANFSTNPLVSQHLQNAIIFPTQTYHFDEAKGQKNQIISNKK